MKKILLIIIFNLLCSFTFGEEIGIKIEADKYVMAKNESFNLVVTLDNIKNNNNLEIEGLENFKVISKSQSQSTTMINFKTTIQIGIRMVLIPKIEGKAKIKAKMKYEGKNYQSNDVEIEVKKESESDTKKSKNEKGIFLNTEISKNIIYEGEKIVFSTDLFTKYNINGAGFVAPLKFDNFISKDVEQSSLKKGYEIINGEQFLKYEAVKTILTPVKSGKYTIMGFKFQANVVVGDSFFGSVSPQDFTTDEKNVTVMKMPEGKPVGFSGIIGEPEMEVEVSSKKIKYGEAVTVKIRIFGECNLDSVSKIFTGDIEDVKIYESEKNFLEEVRGGKYYAEKSYEIALIPEKIGKINFLGKEISYFDTKAKRYVSLKIEPFEIEVSGNGEEPAGQISGSSNDITIDRIGDSVDDEYLVFKIKKVILFSILIIIGLLIALSLIVLTLVYMKNLNGERKKILSRIRKCKTDKEIYNVLFEGLKEKTGKSIKALSSDDIREQFDTETANMLTEINGYFENKDFGKTEHIEIKKYAEKIIKNFY